MKNFSISCQESKIENNKSFYGSFCLGTFDQSLSLTIANSLRRVLLSEINGLGIVSVQIQGVTHEYSNLEGVHEPVLDILLNLKELVLKKNLKNFKPQIAYLNVQGPGIVRASDIVLPFSIQCVDPDQYIATLSENGILNMKIYINYGNKWLMSSNNTLKKSNTSNVSISKIKNSNDSNYEIRSLIINKLRELGFISSSFYTQELINKGSFLVQSSRTLEKIKLQKLNKLRQEKFASIDMVNSSSFDSSLGTNPKEEGVRTFPLEQGYRTLVPKGNDFGFETKKSGINISSENLIYPNIPLEKQIKMGVKQNLIKLAAVLNKDKTNNPSILIRNEKQRKEMKNFLKIKKGEKLKKERILLTKKQTNQFLMVPLPKEPKGELEQPYLNSNSGSVQEIQTGKLIKNYTKKYFLNQPNSLTIDSIFNPINKVNYVLEINDFKRSLNLKEKASTVLEFYQITKSLNLLKTNTKKHLLESFSESDISVNKNKKEELSSLAELKQQINALQKETTQHNIILEIWTNGSIHPRDALYQAFKKLIKTFSLLYKVNPLITSNFNIVNPSATKENYLLKQNKINSFSSQSDKNLIPLNETYFIDTYLPPSVKNFYINNNLLSFPNPQSPKDVLIKNSKLLPLDLFRSGTVQEEQNINLDQNRLQSFEGVNFDFNKNQNREIINNNIKLSNTIRINKFSKLDISYLRFSLRTYTVLKRLNINTIENLLTFVQTNLNNSIYKNLNKNEIYEIKKNLLKFGYK